MSLKNDDNDLSEYEKIRLDNILRNEKFLEVQSVCLLKICISYFFVGAWTQQAYSCSRISVVCS